MAIDKNSFFKYQEHRAQSGYRTAILVRESGDTVTDTTNKYSLLIASETVPAIFGTPETFDFDLLNSPVKGKVEGKSDLEATDVECLLHRDNIYRLFKLKDKVLDFLYLTPDFVGYKFSGTITFRPNEAGADVLRGTYTITPMSADPNPIFDCRDMIEETLCFEDAIPERIKSTDTINLSLVQKDVTAKYTIVKINKDGTTATGGTDSVTATAPEQSTVSVATTGLYAITATATGYAPWTTTVYIDTSTN